MKLISVTFLVIAIFEVRLGIANEGGGRTGLIVKSVTTAGYDFVSGFLLGLQATPENPSICIQAFNGMAPSWQSVADAIQYTWDSGVFDSVFLILSDFDTFLGLVVTTMQKCDVNIFTTKIKALATVEGAFKAMYALGINIDSMSVISIQNDFWNLFSDLINGYYQSAGIDLGRFSSTLINFYL